MKAIMEGITLYFGNDEEETETGNKKEFLGVPKGLFAATKYVDIPEDVLLKNIDDALEKVTKVFEKVSNATSKFEIDEIELGLNIGADGKVSVVALEGTASLNTSIKVKLKRK